MKTFLSLFILLVAFQARASDTSGCTFIETTQQLRTNAGLNLVVKNSMINIPTCWNANDSAVIISYEWLQNSPDNNHQVQFWVSVNSNQSTLNAQVSCQQIRNLGYSPDTTGQGVYKCVASARVLIGYQQSVSVEVAPLMDGSWDTRGFQKNYNFRF